MSKTSFSKGYAKEMLSKGRAPMVSKIDTGETIIHFETSFKQDRAWKIYHFLIAMADDSVSPKEAFNEAFTKT
jgi:hypothetical protein